MPSRPLSTETSAVVETYNRLHNQAMDITKDRTDMHSAVARLVQFVPPARVDSAESHRS